MLICSGTVDDLRQVLNSLVRYTMQFRLLRTSIGMPSSPKAFPRFADSADWHTSSNVIVYIVHKKKLNKKKSEPFYEHLKF